ncbi:DUF6048 family protein [Bergeyella sp. RCAD1439]|uniref:DUF6048 family protein n=1 Tax=Bergeyella anatis TaxID=3113737 RepID=UPI002E18F742|nr:DUF6048 family protein [Bergeyella sp. RCAD1439]
MKITSIFIFCFSLFSVFSWGQDSLRAARGYVPNVMVGVDVLNAGIGFFSDRKMVQGFVSSKIRKDIHAVVELGYDKNVYRKNGYDARINGWFLKAGGFYMLSRDSENDFNGFYAGPKIGASFYSQTYAQVPVRGRQSGDAYLSFDASSQSSYWLEAGIGGRVQLFESPFYIDVGVQPRYLLYTTKQSGMQPMVVPGFGKSSGRFAVGFAWNVAYRF